MTKSILDEVPGIGPVKKNLLLKEFKSIKKMKEASQEDLQKVVGKDPGSSLYARLHAVKE